MMRFLTSLALLAASATVAHAIPLEVQEVDVTVETRASGPSVTIANGTVIGSSSNGVDSFKGIPFAKPPTGQLRLKSPQSLDTGFATIQATGTPASCPQFLFSVDKSNLPLNVVGILEDTPFGQTVSGSSEDCLTLNVQRPSTATPSSKLPVLVWIYGGGFEFGATSMYDGSGIVSRSVMNNQPVIYVAMNYRLGGFGFLAGKELQKDGSTNLGLKDQRLALEWVQDNIAAFGGDPTKVTIWGESAGAISVFDHTIINHGDNTYHGAPLFRGAIMNSGNQVPAQNVSHPIPQAIYDTVVRNAGCSSASDSLTCLRSVSTETFLNAANSVPGIISYRSLDLSYLPRPDPTDNFFPVSPEVALENGNFAKVPVINGDQQDEGTLFALEQGNITSTALLVSYLSTYFPDASTDTITQLVNTYPDNPAAGSPFNTGLLYNLYPEQKRLAAILGDLTFTLSRRNYLSIVSSKVPAWSYLATFYQGLPVLGTFHATDIAAIYFGLAPVPQATYQTYYINFVNNLDPNQGSTQAPLIAWPQWSNASNSPQLLDIGAAGNTLIPDDFRSASYAYLKPRIRDFRV